MEGKLTNLWAGLLECTINLTSEIARQTETTPNPPSKCLPFLHSWVAVLLAQGLLDLGSQHPKTDAQESSHKIAAGRLLRSAVNNEYSSDRFNRALPDQQWQACHSLHVHHGQIATADHAPAHDASHIPGQRYDFDRDCYSSGRLRCLGGILGLGDAERAVWNV